MNKFKSDLENRKPLIGAWQQIPSPVSAEAMCSMNFDWICVDLEHSRIGAHQVEDTIVIAELYDVPVFARLPNADPFTAKKLLDSGLSGLIIAGVEDPEDFSKFASHCRYPQDGVRGVGLARSNRWGDSLTGDLENYRPILIPQIESARGVASAAEIATIEDVGVLFLGPYDLSASLGQQGDFESSAYKSAKGEVLDVCNSSGIAAGIHQVRLDPDGLDQQISDGFTFIAYGTDVVSLRLGFRCLQMEKQN